MSNKNLLYRWLFSIVFAVSIFSCTPSGIAAAGIALIKGQTVYVPVYSNVIAGPREVPVHLSNTLIIRNTDMHNAIQVTLADYYDTKGHLIKSYYQKPAILAPLETQYIYLSDRDQEGGIGANFLIRWHAAKEVNKPIIECVMVGSQGRSFVSPSQEIEEDTK